MSEPVINFKRLDERSNMFLAATIYVTGGSSPVRVRNLSTWGAMLDGGVVPPVGAPVQFDRGQLSASGTVVWAQESRFGVKLSQPIEVSRWLAPPKNPRQEAVDRMFQERTAPTTDPEDLVASTAPIGVAADSVAAIQEVVDLLSSMGDRLSDDLTVVGQHGDVLQNLDRALQILGRLKTPVEA